MYTSKGASRTVKVFQKIVLKFPRIYLKRAGKRTYKSLRDGYFWKSIKWGPYSHFSPMRFLFKGFFDNWLEFYYYQKIKSPFLQPTYFSLFGLMNIQKTGTKPNISPDNFLYQLLEITNGEIIVDGHVFENQKKLLRRKRPA